MASRTYETAIKIEAQLGSAFKSTLVKAGGQLERLSRQAGQLKDAKRGAAALEALERASRPLTRGEKVAAALAQEADAARKLSKELSKATGDTSKLTAALGASQARLEAFAARARASASLSALGAAGARVRDNVRSLAGDVVKLGGLGIAAGVGLFAVAKSTAEAGVDIEKTATRLGTTTEALQVLRIAGKKTGVDIEALDQGLGKLGVNLGKVLSTKGKGGAAAGLVGNVGEIQILGDKVGGAKAVQSDPFKHLGLSAKELAKLEPEKQVERISDAINKLGTHAEKSAAVVQIFGRGGLQLLPLIEKGSGGLEELFAQARASGNLLSNDTIENSKKFHIALLGTEGAIGSVKNTLGAALLPVVTNVLGRFTKYVTENRAQIKIWATQSAKWLEDKAIPALVNFGKEGVALGKRIVEMVGKGADLVGGFKNLAAVVVAIRLAPLAKSIFDVGAASVKAVVGIGQYVAAKWSAVAATRALNAAEKAGIPGSPAAVGTKIGSSAGLAMVAGAGAAGWAIGSAIDERLKISDTAGGKLGETGLEANSKADETLRYLGAIPGLGGIANAAIVGRQRDLAAANAEIARHSAALREGGGKTELHIHIPVQHTGNLNDKKTAKELADHLTPRILEHVEHLRRRQRDEAKRLSNG